MSTAFRGWVGLVLASWLALFCQLLVIRWLSAEIRVFTYLKNLPLLAAFLGLGIGSALAARRTGRSSNVYPLFPPLALALAVLVTLARPLGLIHVPLPSLPAEFWAWTETPFHSAEWQTAIQQGAHFLGIVLGVAALATAVFVPLGFRVGRAMSELPRVPSYAVNLVASLGGVLTFVVFSALEWPPAAWWAAAAVPAAVLLFLHERPMRWPNWVGAAVLAATPLVVAAGAASVAGPTAAGGVTLWSPYYRLDFAPLGQELEVSPVEAAADAAADRSGAVVRHRQLRVNYDYHQRALDLSDASLAAAGGGVLALARDFYDLPYRFAAPAPRRVLIVGSGMGNDVAAAVRGGAQAIDAVEIDPAILRLGTLFHPERPYEAAQVRRINDDARAYFRRALVARDAGYDLVVFGLLDSHSALATLAGLRLDSYVYTRESLAEARQLLGPGGTLALSFGTKPGDDPGLVGADGVAGGGGDGWLARRLFRMLTEVFGAEPLALDLAYDGSTTFVAGQTAAHDRVARSADVAERLIDPRRLRAPIGGASVEVPTDDWPFLYLRDRSVPFLPYGLTLLGFGALGAVAISSLLGQRASGWLVSAGAGRLPFDWPLFWLGAGFMLVETRAIAELSLLFGSTWTVTSVAISAILALALVSTGLAVLVARAGRAALWPWWIALGLALVTSYAFPFSALREVGYVTRALLGGFGAGLPLAFSGVIFVSLFARRTDAASAFGANLLGALVGGAAEYVALAAGNRSLAVVAAGLYALAALAAWRGAPARGALTVPTAAHVPGSRQRIASLPVAPPGAV